VPCPVDGGGTLPASVPVSATARGGAAGVDTLSGRSALDGSDGSTTVDGEKVSRIAAKQLQLAEAASGIDLTVMQGGYADQQHYAASGSSHNYPGVVDVSPGSVQVETLLRRYGFAAWARNIEGRSQVGSGAHVHAVSLLDPGDRTSPQVYGSWAGHKDGLGGGPGSDPAPHYAWVAGLVERVGGVELAPSSGDPDVQSGLQLAGAQCFLDAGAGGSLSALGPADGPSYELATFNLLGANHHRGAPWRTRLAATKRLLAKHSVDVAALQEVHPPQSSALPALVGGTYARFYTAKRPDNQLIWRRDMFTIDRSRSRMVPITYFHGHKVPMPLVRLVRNSTGQGAYYFGVHNPASVHGPAAHLRTKAVEEAWAAIRSLAGTREPVYYLGDMNDKQRFANMIRGKLRSAMVPGYTGIDWITQTGGGTAGRAIVDDSPLVDLASDHPIVVARVATGAGTGGTAPVAASTPPSSTSSPRERWAADVRTAMRGANTYIAGVAATMRRPAINLDIDNTSLATEYATGRPVRPVLRFARTAHRNGVAVLFNTGRWEGRDQLVRQLRSVRYPVDGICLRTSTREPLAASKQRCRAKFTRDGYQLLANVGNRATDFTGGGYGRGFKLPDYAGRLS
jgi:endonuclease/exonuclease/phosphatase family metal-dependent hydrolase